MKTRRTIDSKLRAYRKYLVNQNDGIEVEEEEYSITEDESPSPKVSPFYD